MNKKQLTDKQRQLLSLLNNRWNYIAKDENGTCVCEVKPEKYENLYYVDCDNPECSLGIIEDLYEENMFDYLSLEDEEATLIADLLKSDNV